jgi:hypothetical protein
MSLDYTIFYKSRLSAQDLSAQGWDIFISAFNLSDRVTQVFKQIQATRRMWVVHREYGLTEAELPKNEEVFRSDALNEADFIIAFFSEAGLEDVADLRICVDITGFRRPHLMFLIKWLQRYGVTTVDVLYSEPVSYSKREATQFSKGSIDVVRQVAGFEGVASRDTSNDLLIVGAGYDDRLIAEVAEHKDKADKIQIFGLPSLRADMYQQNLLRAHRAANAIGESHQAGQRRYYGPANDPFATATVLSEIVERRNKRRQITNLYLPPLATKPQALGFALFFLGECEGTNCSIIFLFSSGYEKETGVGVSRTWRYTIEFPLIS